jgi:hypothetical protein
VILERKPSLEEYFQLEQTLELRHEFVDGELIEKFGTTLQHNDIVQNFVLALTRVARAKGCQLSCESVKPKPPMASSKHANTLHCQVSRPTPLLPKPNALWFYMSAATTNGFIAL